jgi:hypothetical protein
MRASGAIRARTTPVVADARVATAKAASLERQGGPPEACRRQADERKALEGVDLGARVDGGEQPRDDVELDPEALRPADEIDRFVDRPIEERHDDPLDLSQRCMGLELALTVDAPHIERRADVPDPSSSSI